MATKKKPSPKMLGTGMARKAGDAIKNRQSRIDAAIDKASGGRKKKSSR